MDLKLENMYTINTSILRYNNAILQKKFTQPAYFGVRELTV